MKKNKSERKIDMLNGSIYDKILLFAMPLAATAIAQQLFNACDIAVVGRFAGSEAMAAVGCNTPVVGMIVNFFLGISIGSNVIIARHIGANRRDRISLCVHTSILFAIICGFIFAIGTQFIAPSILRLLSVPDNVFDMALIYLRIYCAGIPVVFIYNCEAAIFRSFGDTKTPLFVLIISGFINVFLNMFFVIVLRMSASGVATATIISQFFSALMLFIILAKRQDEFKISMGKLGIDASELIPIIKVGLPAGINGLVFSISNVCLQSGINSLGSNTIAGNASALNLEFFTFMFYNSFGQTATTFVSQNFGAGNLKRARQCIKAGLILDVCITGVISFVMLYFANPLLSIFNPDPVIIKIALVRMTFIFTYQLINTVNDFLSGALRGYGLSLVPALAAMITVCGTRITGVFTYFAWNPSYYRLMSIIPLSWLLNSIVLIPVFFYSVKKLEKNTPYIQ